MAFTLVDEMELLQMHPGTILRVEEGQDCALLCASDDNIELSLGTHPGTSSRQPPQAAGPRGAAGLPPPSSAPAPATAACPSRNVGMRCNPTAGSASNHCSGGGGGRGAAVERAVAASGGRGQAATAAAGGTPTAAAASRSTGGGGGSCASGPDGYDDTCDDEYDFGEGEGDGATATAGEGSSAGDDTETFSELSDPGGTEVVFVREGVAVWPGARTERIMGRLSLVKQCNVLFMAWLPYSRGVLQADGTFRVTPAEAAAAAAAKGAAATAAAAGRARQEDSERSGGQDVAATAAAAGGVGGEEGMVDPAGASDRTLYAVHPIPLSEVRALRRREPPLGLGCPSLVVVLTSGVTLPPLYFHRGGIKALIATLKQHAFLLKSATDPHTYLVNDTADPLSRSLCALQLADVLIGGPPPGASATFEPGGAAVAVASWISPAGTARDRQGPPAAAAAAGRPAAAALADGGNNSGSGSTRGGGLGAGLGGGMAGWGLGGGVGVGVGVGVDGGLGSAVTWSWTDPPRARQTAAVGGTSGFGFETIDGAAAAAARGGAGGGEGQPAGGVGGETEGDGGGGGPGNVVHGGGAVRHHASVWAYGIVDAINRFVQNVRGTASGWIGAFDELDDVDGDLYGGYGDDEEDDDDGDLRCRGARDESNGRLMQASDHGREAASATAVAAESRLSYTRNPPAAQPGDTRVGSLGGDQPASRRAGDGAGNTDTAAAAATAAARPAAAAAAAAGAAAVASTDVGDFELLDGGGCWGEAAAHTSCRRRVRPPPLSPEEWAAMFDGEGRLVREAALRDRVCLSGCAPELRREVWKHLLGMYPRGSTAAQRAETAQRWQSDYASLRRQWQSLVPEQEARCAAWRGHRTAVDKDVRRTDRTHPFFAREGGPGLRALRNVLLTHVVYDRDLGYCQGMSDLASPLLVVMRDEAEAFWAFAALMGRLGPNFHSDLRGMSLQLEALRRLVQLLDPQLHAYLEARDCLSYYFAFRWLLILFKREFKFDEVLSLWEACWACRRTRHLHLYLAAAVLVQHRRVILSSELDFDGLLRLSIGLAGRLELQPLLETAEALAGYAGEAGREVTAGLP